jgi:ribonuclease BN (tRNA processing enzyme)
MTRTLAALTLLGPLLAASGAAPRTDATLEPLRPSYGAPARADSAVLVLLGTGMPRPNPEASGPATAVVVGGRLFLFDAGPGVMRQLAAAGLSIKGPTAVFVTHLHSDHTLGLPDLILTSWVMGRQQPMALYGPTGLTAMTGHIAAAWGEDIAIRTDGLEREARDGWRVKVREIRAGVVYDSGGVRVTAIRVDHGDWKEAYGYRIDAAGRSFVVSGDTRPSAALQQAARGADILVHEAYPETRLAPEDRPGGENWPAYMKAFHSSDVEVGALAKAAGVKQVVLHHLVRMQGTDAELIAGVRRGGFTGPVVVGKDLQRF